MELWSVDRDGFRGILTPSMQEELIHQAHLRDTNFTLKSLEPVRLRTPSSERQSLDNGHNSVAKYGMAKKRVPINRVPLNRCQSTGTTAGPNNGPKIIIAGAPSCARHGGLGP